MECRELSEPLSWRALTGTATDARRVLLVVAAAARMASLQRSVRRVMPDAHVQTDHDALDALLSAARRRTDLIVLDAELPGGASAALVRHFGRIAPGAALLVFGEAAGAVGCIGSRPWSEVEPAIRRWLQTADSARGEAT